MRKISTDSTDLLKQMRDAIEKVHGANLADTYDPLVEMAVYAAGPGLSPMQKFAANREVAQYIYPKRKAVEHSGEQGGLNVVVMQFTPDGAGRIVAGELNRPEHLDALDGNPDPTAPAELRPPVSAAQ